MNYSQRFKEIYDFLQPYQRICQNEIMLLYPDPLADFPDSWINEIASFRNKSDIIELEKKNVQHLLKNPSLLAFYQRIEELSTFSPAPSYPAMPESKFTFLYTIPKKQHEIRKLAPFVNAFFHEKKIERILDIGGGIGLLAQTLNNQYNLKISSLDMDPELQKTGFARHEKNAHHPGNKVEYINVKVNSQDLQFTELLASDRMTLGLHTCGPLAADQIRASAKNKLKGLINFGCCYHKLEHDPESQNISSTARSLPHPIELNHFALTLASRAHRKMDEKDYDLKLKVKLYRYAIHFLLHDEYDQKELLTLGNSHPRLYEQSFGTYVYEQFQRVNIAPKHSIQELDLYFADSYRQELIWKMLAAGLIRNALGRLLELYILLDRVCYLEEHGYDVQLYEFFEEPVSPRNLGIVASLPTV